MKVNFWSDKVVNRLEKDWKSIDIEGNVDLFQSASSVGATFIDLGCGIGRFLSFLKTVRIDDFEYTGFDSSESMIRKAKDIHPDFEDNFFAHDILTPIDHIKKAIVICNDVMIHLDVNEQMKLLKNINALKPEHVFLSFQIGSPKNEILPLEDGMFRNMVQSEEEVIEVIEKNITRIQTLSKHIFHIRSVRDVSKLNILIKRYV